MQYAIIHRAGHAKHRQCHHKSGLQSNRTFRFCLSTGLGIWWNQQCFCCVFIHFVQLKFSKDIHSIQTSDCLLTLCLPKMQVTHHIYIFICFYFWHKQCVNAFWLRYDLYDKYTPQYVMLHTVLNKHGIVWMGLIYVGVQRGKLGYVLLLIVCENIHLGVMMSYRRT